MIIRRLQYNIDYTHILTFREEYKQVVLPYFGFDNLKYGIDNENTINEGIRLIFTNEKIALFLRKDGFSFLYEGDVNDLKNQNGAIKFFWDIYENIKKFNGYKKTNRHSLIAHAVKILDKEDIDKILKDGTYLKLNPFGKLDDFASVYEFKKDNKLYKFNYGNFSEKDIKIHDLTPFKTDFNKELFENLGLMCKTEIYEEFKAPTFSRFKALLAETESLISSYNLD